MALACLAYVAIIYKMVEVPTLQSMAAPFVVSASPSGSWCVHIRMEKIREASSRMDLSTVSILVPVFIVLVDLLDRVVSVLVSFISIAEGLTGVIATF